jgi:endonuclease IV
MAQLGPHVARVHSKKKRGRPSIVEHIRAARAAAAEVDFDARAFQIFIAGPRNRTVTLRDEEADELRAYLDRTKTVAVAHGTYADYPWSGAPYLAKFIRLELELCARAGISGLVIHLGKPPIETVMKYLPRLVSPQRDTLVFLEVPHVKPEDSHYETPEKLAELFVAVRRLDPALCRFGLCIDTAHLWSCGVDLRSFEDAEAWIRRLEAVADVIPPDRIMLHLNDSHSERGSGLDRHAPLLGGKLWAAYADRPQHSGLAAFVDYAVRHNTIAILERKPIEALLDDYAALERLTDAVRLGGEGAPPITWGTP